MDLGAFAEKHRAQVDDEGQGLVEVRTLNGHDLVHRRIGPTVEITLPGHGDDIADSHGLIPRREASSAFRWQCFRVQVQGM
ncbi:hypothetical protein D3C73_1292300 [compost metagenome]